MTNTIDLLLAQSASRLHKTEKAARTDLKARYIAARRWHTQAITALDALWRVANAEATQVPPNERLAIWQALEADLGPYLVGMPEG